jgi:hypothetical protein
VQVNEYHDSVSLTIDQLPAVTVTSDDTGDAIYQPTTPLDDGPHTLKVTETDQAGNTSAETTTSFTVDTIAPPVPTITAPTSGSVFHGSYPSIGVQAQAGETVNLTVDGSQEPYELWTTDSGYAETVLSTAFADGSHTVLVTATDPAGNTSAETTSTFTIDTSEHADTTPVATTPQSSATPPATTLPATTPPVIAPVTVKPLTLAAAMAHLRFRAPKAGVSARHPAKVSIDLGHQRATVTLTVRRKVGKRYRTAATAKLKNRTGKVTYKLTAKVGGRTLKPGAYQLVVQGTSHSKKSKPVVHGFRVARTAHAKR